MRVEPYVEKWTTLEYSPEGAASNIAVWLVNGFYVRNNIEGGIEFTNFGHHLRFPFIPEDEFWIDEYPKDDEERKFFVTHLKIEHALMQNHEIPYDQANDMAGSEETIARLQNLGWMAENGLYLKSLQKESIGHIEDYDLYLVDGRYCRDIYFVDFAEGGNWKRYDWIPRKEVWIGRNDQAEIERKYIIGHEVFECLGMEQGWEYERAHKAASVAELAERRRDNPMLVILEDK